MEVRAVAALSNVELITALLACNRQFALVGAFSCELSMDVCASHYRSQQQGLGP